MPREYRVARGFRLGRASRALHMQLIFRCALVVLALATAAEGAGLKPLGRAPRAGHPCGQQAAVCTISTPVFSFGRHPMSGSTDPIYAQGSVTVSCEKVIQPNFPVTITFDLFGIPANDPRQLASGQGANLYYNVYLDAPHTQVWGDGTRGTVAINDTLELPGGTRNASRTYTLYGQVNGGQPASTGNYVHAISAQMPYGISCN